MTASERAMQVARNINVALLDCADREARETLIATALDQFQGEWNFDMEAAPKDGTKLIMQLHESIYPTLRPYRPDLKGWNGLVITMRHPGLEDDGFDIGWIVAAPVGVGGFPDEWFVAWRPLPRAPKPEER